MSDITDTARKIRAGLRAAFPKIKISTTSRFDSVNIEWEDAGPAVDEVKTALVTAALAKVHQYYSGEHLEADGYSIWFDRYNQAEREGFQRDLERHRKEREEQEEAVAQARKARRTTMAIASSQQPECTSDPTVFEAFERLRQRAEAAAHNPDSERRPTWAPPLLLGEKLAEVCLELGYLTLDDKLIGRLWAEFASPKRSGKYLREHVSTHPLRDISCRGFQLFAGGERQTVSRLLFEAQRHEDGTWRFGPWVYPTQHWSPHDREWERLIRERVRLGYEIEHMQCGAERRAQVDAQLADINSTIERIEAKDAAGAAKHQARQSLKQRAIELARARVLDFIGAPDVQMQMASRLCGHCCICWKALTDPVSLERGIGPDCYAHLLEAIRYWTAEGCSPEQVARRVGTSVEFVNAIVREAEKRPAAPMELPL